MNANEQLIHKFYSAFQQGDFRTMQNCYETNVVFSDNAFPGLKGKEVLAMWHMLSLSGKDLKLSFANIKAGENEGSCDWQAEYTFSLTGRKVLNKIHAAFII